MERARLLPTGMEGRRVVGSKMQSIMQSQVSDAVAGSRELRELVGFRLGLRELRGFSLRQRKQGVSRPGLKKPGCTKL